MDEIENLDMKIENTLRTAYVVALHAQHQSCNVQIHVGEDVMTHLKSLATKVSSSALPGPNPALWGFPLVLDDTLEPTGIAIHSVQRIA